MTREARGRWGKGRGVGGGGRRRLCPECAGARGARGGGAGRAMPHAAAAAASSLCLCYGSAQFSGGGFRELLVWEPVGDWYPDSQYV